jgi:hypothetical protein
MGWKSQLKKKNKYGEDDYDFSLPILISSILSKGTLFLISSLEK